MIVFCVEQLHRLPAELTTIPQSRLIAAMVAVDSANAVRQQQTEAALDRDRPA